MSRLAKKPIVCPKGTELKITGRKVTVKGPKGTIELEINEGIAVEINNSMVDVKALPELTHKPFLGLCRSLLNNAVIGVSEGYERKLELVGVGFKAAVKGNQLELALGFSHPNLVQIPAGVKVAVDKNTLITVTGFDKGVVGQFSATVRALRPPEPYKGKGVRYQNEVVRKKAGKTASK